MKLKGRITILINKEYSQIELKDPLSSVNFVVVKLTPEQLSAVLSREALVECDMDINGLDKVGRKMIHQVFEFEIPEHLNYDNWSDNGKKLREHAKSLLSHEWVVTDTFSSQNSIFWKGNKKYARCTIRKWV